MARKTTLTIDAETGDALKDIAKLFKALLDGQKEASESQEKLNKEVASISKSAKAGSKGLKLLAKGFSGIGLAIKAAGIGLVLDAFNLFKEVLSENQVIADGFSQAFEGIKIVFNQTIGIVIDLVKQFSETNGQFESLKIVGQSLLTLVLNPLKIQFNQLKLGLKILQLAWISSFLGGGSEEEINAVKKDIIGIKDEIVTLTKETIEAGVAVVKNVGGAIDEVSKAAETAIDKLKEVNVEAANEQAKALVAARNQAKLAGADLEILIAKLENQAEKQRQIRDDETQSIDVRKKANEELIILLEKQGKAAVELANTEVRAARLALKGDKDNIDKRVALKQALAKVEGERERTTSQLSEALVNKNALEKEGEEIINSKIESENNLSIEAKKFNAEQIENDVKRLEKLKEIAEEEKTLEEERLQRIIDNANAGTQAEIDAIIALNEFKEEKRQEDKEREDELRQAKLDEKTLESENELLEFEERRAILAERRLLIEEDEKLTDEEKLARLAEQSELEVALKQQQTDAENALAQSKIDQQNQALDSLQEIFGKETALGKALLVAKQAVAAQELILNIKKDIQESKALAKKASKKATESTLDNVTGLGKNVSASPFPGNLVLIAGYLASAVGIFSAVKSAVGKAGGKSDGGSTPTPSAPSTPTEQPVAQQSNFNIVGEGGSNQLADVIADQTQNQPPARSFVVSSDITSSQQLDRNIEESASVLD